MSKHIHSGDAGGEMNKIPEEMLEAVARSLNWQQQIYDEYQKRKGLQVEPLPKQKRQPKNDYRATFLSGRLVLV